MQLARLLNYLAAKTKKKRGDLVGVNRFETPHSFELKRVTHDTHDFIHTLGELHDIKR